MSDLTITITTPLGPATISGGGDGTFLLHLDTEEPVECGGGTLGKYDAVWAGSERAACHKYLYDHKLSWEQKQAFNAAVTEIFTAVVCNLTELQIAQMAYKGALFSIENGTKHVKKFDRKIDKLQAERREANEALDKQVNKALSYGEFIRKNS